MTKAPMAHKTFSKEQFVFKLHKFKVSFVSSLKANLTLTSVNHSLAALLISKNSFPILESNLLFLKNCSLQLTYSDYSFFTYSALKKKL